MNKKKLRFAILKTLEDNNNPFEILCNEEITEDTILTEGNFLSREGYIIGNKYADNTIYYWGNVSEKGELYLEENSGFIKAYKVAKEIRDWIPFLY